MTVTGPGVAATRRLTAHGGLARRRFAGGWSPVGSSSGTVAGMFALPSSLRPFAQLPAPVVWQAHGGLLRGELPPPLWEATFAFATVPSESGLPVEFAESFDAACRELPCLGPQDWSVLAVLAARGLLAGSEHRRVFVGLQLQKLPPLERHLVQSLVSLPPSGELDPPVLSVVAGVCLA